MSSGWFQLFKPSSGFSCVNVCGSCFLCFVFSFFSPLFSVLGLIVCYSSLLLSFHVLVVLWMVGEKCTHLSGKREAEKKGQAWGFMLTGDDLLNHCAVCKQFYTRNNDLVVFVF